MTTVGEATAYVGGEKVTIDKREGVRFRVGEEDEEITITYRNGKLYVHSHSWAKNLAAIGEAGNVLRLAVVER